MRELHQRTMKSDSVTFNSQLGSVSMHLGKENSMTSDSMVVYSVK